MSLNAATIEILIAKGLTAGDLLEVARATEVKKDPTNALRQARHRAKKSNAVTVTDVIVAATPLDDIYSNPPETTQSPKGDSPKQKRKARLASDFVMPAEWKEFAREKRGWSAADIETEAENFADHWQSTGTARLDWRKTWQTWVRNSRRPDGPHRNDKPISEAERRQASEEHAARLERIGQGEAAAEMRRRFATGPPRSLGDLTSKIVAGARV